MKVMAAVIGSLLLSSMSSFGQTVGPAPDGEPTVAAQRIIRENFDPPDCPLVYQALRLGDGSIKALCTNKETYRIFSVDGKYLAMRCSAVNHLGVGC